MAVLEPYSGDYYLWHYLPSIPAAVIFTLIFLGCTLGLSWRSWKGRVKFCIPFIVGTFCKTSIMLLLVAMLTNTQQSKSSDTQPGEPPTTTQRASCNSPCKAASRCWAPP
jgi:predicted Na+-dependent transporter